MKRIILTLTITLSSVALFAQTKPAVKHKITVSHDSLVNEIDTIPVLFKELVVKPDTVYERWQKGFVLWKAWQDLYVSGTGSIWYNGIGGITIGGQSTIQEKTPYNFDATKADKFLYQNYEPVKNKVLTVIKP